jgi:sporulation protein YlmC with PRC-barrel domain
MKKLLVSVILPVLVVAPITAAAQRQNLVDTRDLIGMRIKSDLDKDLGAVESLLIDPQTGKVSEVVVGVGGVLGIAEKRVVVPWSDLQLGVTTDGSKLVAKMNEAKLEAAPRYDRSASAARDRASSPSASPSTTPMK